MLSSTIFDYIPFLFLFFLRYSDPCTLISRLQTIVDDLLLSAKDSKENVGKTSAIADETDRSVSESQTTAPSVSASDSSNSVDKKVDSMQVKALVVPSSSASLAPGKAYDSVTVGKILFPHIQQVSSQGCSRVFIIKGIFIDSLHSLKLI